MTPPEGRVFHHHDPTPHDPAAVADHPSFRQGGEGWSTGSTVCGKSWRCCAARTAARGAERSRARRGRSRKTVQRYLTAAAALGWQPGQREPDEPLAAQILAQLRPGVRDRAPSEAEQRLLPHRETLRGWLSGETTEGRPLTLTKCHDLLTRRGVTVTYSSLYRFAVKHAGLGDRPATVRMAAVAPGELAEIDFGRLGLIPDGRLDRRRVLWALVITLVHSRHQYVHLTHAQTLAEVIGGLEDAWTFFGGVPARVVVDNLRAAIAKADRYDPVFARVFEEYSQSRGFVIDPAPPAMPTGKPHVERQVPYVPRALLSRGDLPQPRPRPARGHPLVRRHGWAPRPRHDPPAPARGLRGRGARGVTAARGRALRPAALGPGQGPPGPSHPLRPGPLLRAASLSAAHGRRPR